jgi:hypothetical protein
MSSDVQLSLHDLPFDCLELIMAHVAWGADRPRTSSSPHAAEGGGAAALAHPAAVCTALRAAAFSILARCTHVNLTPPAICASILCTKRPSPDQLAGAAPTVTALLTHATSALAVDLSRGHAYVSDSTLDALAAASCSSAGRLTSLRLDHCTRVTSAGLAHLAAATPNLASLSVAGVPAAGEPGALAGFTALTDLDVSWVRGPGAAAPLHRGLATARLRGCEAVGDAALPSLVPAPSLAHLDIAFTSVSDAGLAAIAAGCPALRTLTIANSERCDEIWSTGFYSAGGLRRFRAAAPGVEVVLVSS